MKKFVSTAMALAMVATLPSCSVSTPVRVSMPQATELPDEVAIDVGRDAPATLTQFAASFERQLSASGTRIKPVAGYHLALALSSIDSSIGVTSDPGKDPRSIKWQSSPRKGSLFDGCKPQRLRAVVVGSQGISAMTSLRAEAELDSCKVQPAELDRLAASLVEAIRRR